MLMRSMIAPALALAFGAIVHSGQASAQSQSGTTAQPQAGAAQPQADAAKPQADAAQPQAAQGEVTQEDGKYFTADGDPTFNIGADGTVDWYTYSGFRRYHSECHVCHGPDGEGSTYAPALANSLKTMDYAAFLDVVTNGRTSAAAGRTSVMPSFGTNPNVMCYIDDLYIYLKARAVGGLPRGRPEKREDKPEAFQKAEDACFGRG